MGSSISEIVGKKMFSKPKRGEIPIIHCRRNFPGFMTYRVHDPSWEAYTTTIGGDGKIKFVIDRNTGVYSETSEDDCYTPIHDTPNNRKRLERMAKGSTVKEGRMVTDVVSGEETEEEISVFIPPMFEIIEDNLIDQSMVKKLMASIEKEKERMAAESNEPEEEDDAPFVEDEENITNQPRIVSTRKGVRATGKSIKSPVGA